MSDRPKPSRAAVAAYNAFVTGIDAGAEAHSDWPLWESVKEAAILAALDLTDDERTSLRDAIAPHLHTDDEVSAVIAWFKARSQGGSDG